MGYGALGAGGITAFTALFKYSLAAMGLPPLWIGVAQSLNYSTSFVLMQFLGWRLASKMPSMTAAALCAALQKDDGMQSEVRLVAAITRAQTIVTLGNLLGAIPLAILIDGLISGVPAIRFSPMKLPSTAWNPCIPFDRSPSPLERLPDASSGRLPAAIAQCRRIRRSLGADTAAELSELIQHHMSGVTGHVCLGLLLGLLPFVSVFAGVPVEVRHVTLASASLAYDVSSLAWNGSLPWGGLVWAALGLLATGIFNFSVSFALGLWLALRARNLHTKSRGKLIVALRNEFRQHPARFLWRHDFDPSGSPDGSKRLNCGRSHHASAGRDLRLTATDALIAQHLLDRRAENVDVPARIAE